MKITVLAENTCRSGELLCEHGLSLYIQSNNKNILFDMGQTGLFSENAVELGVRLAETDLAIISHGHYDHGGGLKNFLEINKTAPIYINKRAFGEYFNRDSKYIGLEKSLSNNDRIRYVSDDIKLCDGIHIISGNGNTREFPDSASGMKIKKDGVFIRDEFLHEQYVLIEENGRRILFSGCSHKGIINLMNWYKPDVLVGGFHFSRLECSDKLREYSELLDSFGAEYYTCHCTGKEQFEFMSKYMKKLHYISTGDIIVL